MGPCPFYQADECEYSGDHTLTVEPQKITKLAKTPEGHSRGLEAFPSGRSAFKSILVDLIKPRQRLLLLPAYIGWSAREGSGVFDPVRELGMTYEFYKVTDTLEIDQKPLLEQLAKHPGSILLLIHYFGRVDPGYQQILNQARSSGAEVIEDEAHAMLTDLVGGISGRAGSYAFFSLHKLLPLKIGGAKIYNRSMLSSNRSGIPAIQMFDLNTIAQVRIRNYNKINELMKLYSSQITPLWPTLLPGEVPQTYPIRLKSAEFNRNFRDEVYERMNKAGYGVVSLYHTLIDRIDPAEYPKSHGLANSILNLPVHQDLNPGLISGMLNHLSTILDDLS